MPTTDPRGRLKPALALIGLVTLARVLYLALVCPYHLVEDEAQYWVWAQYLDWSYYSKGPGVAWAIALSTAIFGDAAWAVRLPTVLMSGLGAACVATLARDVARAASARDTNAGPMITRAALYAAACVLLAPALQMTGILMTIDGPYVACWAAACLCAWRAMASRGGWWVWLGLGGAIALGFVFKYTILLLVPGLVVFGVLARRQLATVPMWKAKAAAALIVGLSGLAPVLVWNSQRGWPTVKHLLGHLGMAGGDMPTAAAGGAARDGWSPTWSIELLGMQAGMYGPWLVLGAWAAVRAWRRRPRAGAGSGDEPAGAWMAQAFLICCAAPIVLFYLGVSLIAEPEGNWPMAGNITLMALGAVLAAQCVTRARAARDAGRAPDRDGRGFRWMWRAGAWYAAVAAVLLHFAVPIADALNRLSQTTAMRTMFQQVLDREPRPIVLGRLIGAREMAVDVSRLLDGLRAGGSAEPFVITQHYGRASQLIYENRGGRPVDVLCGMAYTGGRRSQYDLWTHTSLSRPDLRGRDAVILSNDRPDVLEAWGRMFERVEPAVGLGPDGRLAGEHKRDRFVFIGRGYRGPGT